MFDINPNIIPDQDAIIDPQLLASSSWLRNALGVYVPWMDVVGRNIWRGSSTPVSSYNPLPAGYTGLYVTNGQKYFLQFRAYSPSGARLGVVTQGRSIANSFNLPTTPTVYNYNITANGTDAQLYLYNPDNAVDIVVDNIQVNFNALAPFSPAAGFPTALNDISNHGLPLQYGAAAAYSTDDPTILSNALAFDGTKNQYAMQTAGSLNKPSGVHMIAVFTASNLSAFQCIAELGASGYNLPEIFGLYVDDFNKARAYLGYNGSSYPTLQLNKVVTDGAYHYFEGWADQSTFGCSIDGKRELDVTSGAGLSSVAGATSKFCLGKNVNGTSYNLTGNIAFAALIGKKLQPAERKQAFRDVSGLLSPAGIALPA